MASSTRKHPYSITLNNVWDVNAINWVPMTQPGGGGGGGGDASAANQVTGNASLAAIKTDVDKIPALGQALAAASTPVVLTAIQVAALTPPAALVGFALEAGHLAAIDSAVARIPAQGQALAALSTPVVLTAIQVAALTPVTGLTDTQLRATPVPVSGTVTANVGSGTQPVSGTFWQATQPVSGTFWQATQPVSIATMPSTPVTGTFWQATQPVSGTVTTAPPANASANIAQLAGTAISVNTGVRDAGTQRVTIATNDVVPVTGTFWQATQPVSGTVTVTPPTLTKGTQGATGLSTQDLKDAGRNQTNYFHAVPIITTVAEVMQTLTGYKSGAAVAATATPAVVTAGKTYRINQVVITYWGATVIGGARVNLRANLSGVGVVGSPLVYSWQVGIPAVFTAGSSFTYTFQFPDGMEFPAGTGIAVGVIGEGAVPTTATITGYVMLAIHGYEY